MTAKTMQAAASLKAGDALASAKLLSFRFSAVELDFSDELGERLARDAINACDRAGLEVKAVHLPNMRRMASMMGSRRLPPSLIALTDAVFVSHAWLRGDVHEYESLMRIADKLSPNSNTLAIENVTNPRRLFTNPSEVRDFFAKPRPFGFCLDTSHVTPPHESAQTEYVLKFINAGGASLAHIHLSDADTLAGKKHLPPGEGRINWGAVFGRLREIEYKSLLTLEIDPATPEGYDRALAILSKYGITADAMSSTVMVSMVGPEEAASMLSRFAGETGYKDLAAELSSVRSPLIAYSDEQVCVVLFGRSGVGYIPFMRQMNFPSDLPECKGFVALVKDGFRMSALYFSRAGKIAVRTTLGDLLKDSPGKQIADFLSEIGNARILAFGSSETVRLKDGSII